MCEFDVHLWRVSYGNLSLLNCVNSTECILVSKLFGSIYTFKS